jgi:hypothetical protein
MQGAEQRLQEKMQDTGVERSEQAVRDRIDDQCIVPTPEEREAAETRHLLNIRQPNPPRKSYRSGCCFLPARKHPS